jgi:hypothetical protein
MQNNSQIPQTPAVVYPMAQPHNGPAPLAPVMGARVSTIVNPGAQVTSVEAFFQQRFAAMQTELNQGN